MTATTQNASDSQRTTLTVRPAVDVVENAAGITVYADMPGVTKDTLSIHVDGDTLQIDGEVTLSGVADMQPVYVETTCPHFRRAFTLSRELDSEHIKAELRQGVLRLHIPKIAEAQPRRIEVQTS